MEMLGQILSSYLQKKPEVKLVYLFGSQVSGLTNRLSDIDVAILVDKMPEGPSYPYGYKAKICSDLMELLKTNRIDLVILNDAPSLLKHRVVSSGHLIYAFNETCRVQFQEDAIRRYLDLKPLLMAA